MLEQTEFPTSFSAGTSFFVTRTFADFPSDTFTSSLQLTNQNNAFTISGTSNADRSFSYIEVPAVTSGYVSADYSFSVITINGNTTCIPETGDIEVTPNVIAGAPVDVRSNAEKILDQINLLLEGKFISDKESYSIAGRSLNTFKIEDLLSAKGTYQSLVNAEKGEGLRPVLQEFHGRS